MADKKVLEEIQADTKAVEDKLREMITTYVEEIKKDPSLEKEIILTLADSGERVYQHFMKELQRTGNENIGKNVMKYVMFKRL